MTQNQRKAQKGHLEGENHKTQESGKQQVEPNGNAMKSLTLPLPFSMQALPLLVEFIMFFTNFSQPPG
jgi:hypothetical protein